jgi:hypothetical protein
MMKFAWRKNIGDLAAWNSSQVEEIEDETLEYKDMLVGDQDLNEWDNMANSDEFYVE